MNDPYITTVTESSSDPPGQQYNNTITPSTPTALKKWKLPRNNEINQQ